MRTKSAVCNNLILKEDIYNKIDYDKKVLKLDNVIINHKEYNNYLLVSELGGVNKYNNFYTDYTLNVVNSYSVYFLHLMGAKCVTLSVEMNDKQIEYLIESYKKRYKTNPNLEIIVYGKVLAMTIKYDLLENNKYGYLIDRFNNKFLIKKESNLTKIYDYKIRDLSNKDKYFDMGINNIRYELNDYS